MSNLEAGIDKLVEEFIASGRPSAREITVAERRQGYLDMVGLASHSTAQLTVKTVQLEGITLRVYSPSEDAPIMPAVIYYHGGCFISGGFDTHDRQMRQIATLSRCRVIVPQYRLAPEHRYPAAHDDAFKAAMISHQHASVLGIDPDRIWLMGDSAGGHLALVTALRIKQSHSWEPKGLTLIYPMLDPKASQESYQTNGDDYLVTRDVLLVGYELYFDGVSYSHPEATLLGRTDFSGLPKTVIVTAEFDPLLDEGELLYRKMTQQGVNVSCQRYLGVIHGFFQMDAISQAARDLMQQICARVATEMHSA